MLKIQNLSVHLKNTAIISDLNIELQLGQRFLWVGPSGVGKSILAKTISGYQQPTVGSVHLNGLKIAEPNQFINYISQDDDLFFWQTVRQHIHFLNNQKFQNQITDVAISAFGLQEYLDLYPSQLSGGTKRRLQLLRCLSFNSSVVILDETLSAMDLKLRNEILVYLDPVWKKNNALIICITHQEDEFLKNYFSKKILFPLN